MEKKWDGKTKGSLWGYRFFVFCIRFFGVRFSYFFGLFVVAYYVLFSAKERRALVQFYTIGFGFGASKAFRLSANTFYRFAQVLIDRVALKTWRKKQYTHSFQNEEALRSIYANGKGGFFIADINVLMLDAEVEKIKQYLEKETESAKFKLIPIKDDMSHLITIHQALKRNELIALHADRIMDQGKTYLLPFLKGKAHFPAGPFIMAHKFKVPVTFVFAIKKGSFHYVLSATEPIWQVDSPEQLASLYVKRLEEMVQEAPDQWFNFYDYYAH
jgi:predicted LPLAT superfamily acyltransferase